MTKNPSGFFYYQSNKRHTMRPFFACFFFLSSFVANSSAFASEIKIVGSVQFWERQCTSTYVCELPQGVSPRISIDSKIESPQPGYSLSTADIDFAHGEFTGKLSVFWNLNAGDPYLAGQSYLSKDGVRIGECSHYAKADVTSFIPVGFCSGYTTAEDNIKQYGMTFYK
jgi:hypothetical protein